FQPGGDGLLIIVFDENSGSGGTMTTGTTDGGQVECVIVSPFIVSAGFKSTTRHYHESLLRLMEQGLGLTTFAGSSASANNMSEFFGAGATSTATVSPTSLTFANQTVGTTSAAQFSTLTNSGSTTITIGGITISGDFALAGLGTCGTSLAAGSSCTISVNFTPTATGTRTGTVTVNDSATGSPQTISLAGSGVSSGTGSPAASLSPTSLTFGNQNVGTTSAARAVTLSNSGSAALSVTSIAVTGTNAGDFAQSNNCGSSVAAAGSCTINVTFTPAASGTRSATVTVTDNATGSPHTAGLTGSGVSSGTGGTNYYVSTTGSDSSGAGSSSSPWATIAYASTKVGPGSTVHVAPGTYSGQFNTNSSGTSSAYITYVSDTKWGAKIAGGSSSTWSNYGAYVTIQGFDVTGPTGCCNAIYTAGNATQIIGNNVHSVQNSNGCSSTGGGGIVVDSTNAQVIGNYAHDNGPSSACNYIHGIYIANSSNPGSGAYVANNISFRNSGWGIQLWHSATQETLVNNTIFNNLTGGIVVGAGSGSGVTDDNTVVSNNIVYNNPGTDGGIVEEGSTGTHNTYTDNLVFGNTPVNISLQNGLTATGTVSANPLFVNFSGTTTGDYHLQSSSPAIDVGTSTSAPTTDYDGNTRPQGGAWDIGAYEYAGSSGSATAGLAPASLTFANQNVGTTSAAQAITLSNTGSAALSISSIAVTGTNSGDFAQSNTCGGSVAAGATCAISVTFKPTASGTRTASVTVTDNASSSPQTASLTGSGVAASTAAASLSPTSLTFASQNVGTTSAAQTVTLSNTGSAALSITSVAITGTNSSDFAQTNGCGSSLAAGSTCTISVTFTPAASGTRTAAVAVTDNATGSPQTAALTGTGASTSTGPVVSLSPASLTFPSQAVGTTSGAQFVTLTNTGNSTLTFNGSFVISGDFHFAGLGNCAGTVAAGASCTISVNFTPTTTGTRTGAVTLNDNAPTSPQTIPLSGTGGSTSTAPAVSLSPTSLTFGNQTVGTASAAQAVTLSNTGNATLTISSLTIGGDFAFAGSGTCGSSVAAGASCAISVDFAPTTTGTRTGTVTITDNASNSPQTISLTGSGVSPSGGSTTVSVSPTSLSFGRVKVGHTSGSQTVTVRNTGTASVTFSSVTISGQFVDTNNCGGSLAVGASCAINVASAPTSSGTQTGTLTISDNASGSPQTVSLTGSGH
ncbi:MAG: hypothetical protein DMG25_11805, partial [Acidobacteria bacterium]